MISLGDNFNSELKDKMVSRNREVNDLPESKGTTKCLQRKIMMRSKLKIPTESRQRAPVTQKVG